MRLDNGTSFDYAYSHVNARNTEFAFDPNEVGSGRAPKQGHIQAALAVGQHDNWYAVVICLFC